MAFKESRVQEKGCYIISFPLEEKQKKNKPTKIPSLPTWQVNHSMPFPAHLHQKKKKLKSQTSTSLPGKNLNIPRHPLLCALCSSPFTYP